MPPGAQDSIGLNVLLLVVGSFLLALVEWVLQADVCLHLAFCGFGTDKSGDIKRGLDLDLQENTFGISFSTTARVALTCSGRSH